VDLKSLLGFEAYSDVLADIVCEPNLSLPLTIGLYAKWGSGKSFLLPKIRESMKSFSRSWLDGLELYWSWSLVMIFFVICALLTLILLAIFIPIFNGIEIVWPLVIGGVSYVIIVAAYGFIYYGSEIRLWNGSITVARLIARTLARLKLVISVATLNAPIRTEKDLVVSPVSFLFADDHRLSFVGGEQTLTNIVHSLYNAAEEHYGTVAVRLFSAFKSQTQTESKLRTLCGIPILFQLILMFVSFILSLILLIQHFNYEDSGFFIGSLVFAAICVFFAITPLYIFVVRMLITLPQRRIKRLAHRLHAIPFERKKFTYSKFHKFNCRSGTKAPKRGRRPYFDDTLAGCIHKLSNPFGYYGGRLG
jgi:ankyrin repeat-rich membrane spanning protein